MHFKDLLWSIARVLRYCIPVPYFYLVLNGLCCQKKHYNGLVHMLNLQSNISVKLSAIVCYIISLSVNSTTWDCSVLIILVIGVVSNIREPFEVVIIYLSEGCVSYWETCACFHYDEDTEVDESVWRRSERDLTATYLRKGDTGQRLNSRLVCVISLLIIYHISVLDGCLDDLVINSSLWSVYCVLTELYCWVLNRKGYSMFSCCFV